MSKEKESTHVEYIQEMLTIETLTKKEVEQWIGEITHMVQQIPEVVYTEQDILSEQKGERLLHGKWERSLIAYKEGKPVGVIFGYERAPEENLYYPAPTIYVSELAVEKTEQGKGIAQQLLKAFIAHNTKMGMQVYADTPVNFSVQTNSASWNEKVIMLYKRFGFVEHAHKPYENRIDVVLRKGM